MVETHVLHGGCHCGNFRFQYSTPQPPDQIPARVCGCTFCTRIGGCYTSHPRASLSLTIRDRKASRTYRFGTRTADFYQCGLCGNTPFVAASIDGRLYAVLNVNMIEDISLSSWQTAPADFSGESLDSRTDRRRKSWIPEVHIAYLSEAGPK